MEIKLGANPISGIVPLEVEFHAEVQGGTPPYEIWNYIFGDGISKEDSDAESSGSSSSKMKYTYTRRGNYPATVTVRDSEFNQKSSLPITINAIATLKAELRAEPTSDPAPPMTWTFWVTYGGGVRNYIVKWDFGDKSPSVMGPTQVNYSAEMRYTFKAPGHYKVTATVTDGELDTVTATIQIDVLNK